MNSLPETDNILIVDDHPGNLHFMQQALKAPGLEVLTAASGKDALQTLQEYPDIALVLMDVQMPDMDGFETTIRIREQPRFQDLPLLFITAVYGTEEFIQRGFDVGAFDYLVKPVDLGVLKSKVNVFLTLHRQKRQLAQEIAERVQAEAELRKTQERLIRAEKLAVFGQLASGVAHELRSPLGAIKNAAYFFSMIFRSRSRHSKNAPASRSRGREL